MAITGFTSTEVRARELAELLGGEYESDDSQRWNSPVFTYRYAIGCVVELRERNGYDDSDFLATYWNAREGKFVEECYASTRGWSYPSGASVDATPEVKELWKAKKDADYERARLEWEAQEARRVSKGKPVRVVSGRKVVPGTVGECIWVGDGAYGKRVGIRDAAGKVHWTAVSNVEVVLAAA
jgi:hypothetical protein